MGKISDALKKIEKQREIEKQRQEKILQENIAREKVTSPSSTISKEKTSLTQLKDKSKKDNLTFARPAGLNGIDRRIVTYYDYNSPISEQYRLLRTNLKSHLLKGKLSHRLHLGKVASNTKILTITSALRGEGKSVTCVNVAVVMAKDFETKVLIIDCDLRNGNIHKLLNIDAELGLTHIFADECEPALAIHPTCLKNLFVLPRGETSSHPTELLDSKKMRFILEKLRMEDFTYIFIDTPPLVPFADARIVGAQTDGVIIVVQSYKTHPQVVKRAKEQIEQAPANLLGFVLTHTDNFIPGLYGAYHYSYYLRNSKSEVKSD